MLHRIGAMLAVSIVTIAGWAGPAQAEPRPATVPTLTPTPVCPPALPLTGLVAGVTQTSVTVSYFMLLVGPPCGYLPPVTVTLFTSRTDAQQWRDPVAENVSGPEHNGDVTIDGLTPDTEYWFRFTDADGRRDTYVLGGPARTLPVTGCVASTVVDASWIGGFIATVTVRNIGTESIDGWQVSWQWPGDERIQSIWGGQAGDDRFAVEVRNAPYNGMVEPDGTTTFGLLVATSRAPTAISPDCTV